MPEGDTLHRIARRLAPALEGARLIGLGLRDRPGPAAPPGARITEVSALGKHLLIGLTEAPGGCAPGEAGPDAAAPLRAERVLHVHLGMHGRVRMCPRETAGAVCGAPGKGPARGAPALWIRTEAHEVRVSRPAVAVLLPAAALPDHPVLGRLGPDLLGGRLDLGRVLARSHRSPARDVADLLLDQRVACGVGNVYKSEVLFTAGLGPATPAAALDDAWRRRLYTLARRLLRWNLREGPRVTVRRVTARAPLRPGEPRHFVYERAGRPCLRCGTAIEVARLGDGARPTFWCPSCQPPAGARGA